MSDVTIGNGVTWRLPEGIGVSYLYPLDGGGVFEAPSCCVGTNDVGVEVTGARV